MMAILFSPFCGTSKSALRRFVLVFPLGGTDMMEKEYGNPHTRGVYQGQEVANKQEKVLCTSVHLVAAKCI